MHPLRIVAALAVIGLGSSALAQPRTAGDPLATQRWQTGRGEPRGTIIYLHGLGCRPDDALVQRITGELARRGQTYRVIAPWLRPARLDAQGAVVADGLHTMSDQLRRARQVIDEQPGRVVLMGHSFGGKAALQLAREYPGKVSCVVTLAPAVNMLYSYWKQLTGERGLPADPRTMKQRIQAERAELGRKLVQARRAGDRKAIGALAGAIDYSGVMLDLAGFDETALENGVARPTLMLHGTADEAVSIHYARRFAEHGAGVQLHELPEAGHGFLLNDRPRTARRIDPILGAAIVRFLDAHVGAEPR